MQKQIWFRGIAFFLLAGHAAAETCVERNQEDFQSRGASLAQLCVTELEATVLELQTQIGTLTEQIDLANQALSKAVVAQHRGQDAPCPDGWSIFSPAGGRMILGAGNHTNTGVSQYPSIVDRPDQGVGGEEAVTLTRSQMPSHQHMQTVGQGQSGTGNGNGFAARGVPNVPMVNHGNLTRHDGGSAAHNNMPPWIALYYCIKE